MIGLEFEFSICWRVWKQVRDVMESKSSSRLTRRYYREQILYASYVVVDDEGQVPVCDRFLVWCIQFLLETRQDDFSARSQAP